MKAGVLSDEVHARLERVRARPGQDLGAFPDFLVVGPQRTGTTWIYHNLRQHPEIFLPRQKEVHFFNTLGRPGHKHFQFAELGGYLDALREGPQRVLKKHYDCLRKCGRLYRPRVRGECTASYARLEVEVIDEIVALNPAMRAILMVRDPVERAWSHAKKALLRGPGRTVEELAQEEFAKFVRASGQRRLANYAKMIEAWRSRLAPGKLYLGDYRRIATDPKGLLGEMHAFLGVDRGERYFNRHLRERINATGKDAMPEAFEELLRGYLAEEIAGFEEVLAEIGA